MNAHCLATAMLLLSAAPAVAQSMPDAEVERVIVEIQGSHMEANVPDDAQFAGLLERDLNAYFASRGVRDRVSRFELLRQGPTQTGIAFPKFYLWVWVSSGQEHVVDGAVRVAAVQRERFEITDFLTIDEIRKDPGSVKSIFPATLGGAIREHAGLGASGE